LASEQGLQRPDRQIYGPLPNVQRSRTWLHPRSFHLADTPIFDRQPTCQPALPMGLKFSLRRPRGVTRRGFETDCRQGSAPERRTGWLWSKATIPWVGLVAVPVAATFGRLRTLHRQLVTDGAMKSAKAGRRRRMAKGFGNEFDRLMLRAAEPSRTLAQAEAANSNVTREASRKMHTAGMRAVLAALSRRTK